MESCGAWFIAVIIVLEVQCKHSNLQRAFEQEVWSISRAEKVFLSGHFQSGYYMQPANPVLIELIIQLNDYFVFFFLILYVKIPAMAIRGTERGSGGSDKVVTFRFPFTSLCHVFVRFLTIHP